MRKFEFLALALPLLASAADVKMVGMGYRGGEAVKAGEELTLTITNATEVGSGYPGRVASSMRIVIWNSIYMWDMCECRTAQRSSSKQVSDISQVVSQE